MRAFLSRPLTAVLALSAAAVMGAATGGCTPVRTHQGYILDVDLINSVQPGIDTRATVLTVLGKPSFAAQFDQGDWYYIARDTHNLAFRRPTPNQATTLRVSFDQRGVVKTIDRTGMEQLASISPYGKTTPTLGRSRSFFQELFGNIGTVGAGGGGGGPGNGGGGAGSDAP
jgi:outer membrane protein assembly factor BamE (lipoprotein component of BamABCDE complex)